MNDPSRRDDLRAEIDRLKHDLTVHIGLMLAAAVAILAAILWVVSLS